jgi:hypothetical protein
MATVAQLEAALIKADAAGNTDDAKVLAAEIRRMRAAEPPAAPTEIPAERQEGFFGRFLRRMGTVGPSAGMVDVSTTARLPQEALEEQARQQAAVGLGFTAGPVLAGVTRLAGTAIPAIQRVTQALAPAFETSGFRTGLPTTAAAPTRVATRIVGAAAPGAIGGLPVDEAGTGAAVSTGVALLAPPVASIVAKGGGYVADALQGRVATARANKLLRETIGTEVNALKDAMRRTQIPYIGAQPDIPPSRVAAQLDLPALSALLAKAEEMSPTGAANAFRLKETQDTVNELARIAGGPTAETARAARETTKGALSELTGRMREESFAAARRTGEVMPRLAEIATSARKSAKAAVQRVRQFTASIDSAEDWAKNWVTQSRLVEGPDGTFTREYLRGTGEAGVRPPGRYTFPGEIAVAAERRAGTAAEESLRAGAQARAAENTLQSMVDRGLQPITVDRFTGPIDNLMNDPDIATNPVLRKALPQIRQMFDDWANQYGVITPEAVYAIRKNGISGVIKELAGGETADSQAKLASAILKKIRPAIEESIEAAGGRGFNDYLRSFERGMSDIRGMELADQIRKWYQSGKPADRKKIVDLLAGESPDVVEDFFGSGRYRIAQEMAKDLPLLERIGNAVQLDIKAAAQAKAGRKPLAEIIEAQSARLRFPFFTRASTAVNEIVQAIEQKVGRETMDEIVKAAQSGRDFNALLNALPTKERSAFLAQFKNADSWGRFSTQVANAARSFAVSQTGEEPDVTVTKIGNRLIEQPNQNALRP